MSQNHHIQALYQQILEDRLESGLPAQSYSDATSDDVDLCKDVPRMSVAGQYAALFTDHRSRTQSFSLYILLGISWIITILVCCFIFYQSSREGPNNLIFPQILYSPLQDFIRYETKVFTAGLDDDFNPQFYGNPSPKIDEAWDNLYNFGSIKLNAWEAARIPNKTWPLLREPGSYVANIQVFHDLHCLNMIRKSLHPDYYVGDHWSDDLMEDGLIGPRHTGHCIESLRHALMCMPDVSVIVWQWDELDKRVKAIPSNARTCRNFDAIRDWASRRSTDPRFDKSTFVPDDPLAGIYNRKILDFVTD